MILERVRNWGGTAEEHARRYPADDYLSGSIERLTRAVTVHATVAVAYRWLCQLSVAPYSYDRLDNWGRRSPDELTDGADRLAVGQRVMVFTLTDVRPGRQFSGRSFRSAERLFGPVAGTYAVEPLDEARCRLICRLLVGPRWPLGRLWATGLACGDLVMMRRQLLNLKKYAERDARLAEHDPAAEATRPGGISHS